MLTPGGLAHRRASIQGAKLGGGLAGRVSGGGGSADGEQEGVEDGSNLFPERESIVEEGEPPESPPAGAQSELAPTEPAPAPKPPKPSPKKPAPKPKPAEPEPAPIAAEEEAAKPKDIMLIILPNGLVEANKKLRVSVTEFDELLAELRGKMGFPADVFVSNVVAEGEEPVALTSLDDFGAKTKVQLWSPTQMAEAAAKAEQESTPSTPQIKLQVEPSDDGATEAKEISVPAANDGVASLIEAVGAALGANVTEVSIWDEDFEEFAVLEDIGDLNDGAKIEVKIS